MNVVDLGLLSGVSLTICRLQVYRAAVESKQLVVAEYALRVVPQDLMKAMLPHANHERVQQLQAIIQEFSQMPKVGAE